jgi:hypothetical protein
MFIKKFQRELKRKSCLKSFNSTKTFTECSFTSMFNSNKVIGDASCPLSMGVLDHAVGGNILSLDACRQERDVRVGWMPNF